jgi:amidase
MSVPSGESVSGLPIGMQFVGKFGEEAKLFSLATQLEKDNPWTNKLPAI